MKIKHGFYASVAALTLSCAGFLSSCEDKCATCNCDSFHVDYVVNPDSMDIPLTQLTSKSTIVIVGSGLGTANGVYLVDKDNNPYSVELNPAFVTDNSIVITLDCDANELRTESLLVTNSGGCQASIALPKPVPAPSIKMFRSEFVKELDTLRVAGNAFLSAGGEKLKVYFEDEKGNRIEVNNYVTTHDNRELLIPVPKGLPDNQYVYVKNQFGEAKSTMMFRDTRNIFLDFDEKLASKCHGALDTFSTELSSYIKNSSDFSKHEAVKKAMGGSYPEGCNGYYAAITSTGDGWHFAEDEMIYLTQYQQGYTTPVDLRGSFTNVDFHTLVLKFEVYIPSAVPLGSWFYIVFSAYGAEDQTLCEEAYGENVKYGYFARDLTKVAGFDKNTFTCSGKGVGTPAAWLNMATLSVDESESSSGTLGSAFHTGDRWMTVAVPLTDDVFKYNVSDQNLITDDKFICCDHLKEKDFYNFFIHLNADGFQSEAFSNGKCFVAFDNFRIVPEDNGGVRFSKYYGPTAASKYPF